MYAARVSLAGVPARLAAAGSFPAETLSRTALAASRAFASERTGYRPASVSLHVRRPIRYRTAHDFDPVGCTIKYKPGNTASGISTRALRALACCTTRSVSVTGIGSAPKGWGRSGVT